MEMRIFHDRADAGRQLARALGRYRAEETVVYGLPRGGVVVAFQVAKALDAPLDLIVARKIGHPGNPEYALGAITDDGQTALNEWEAAVISPSWLEREEGSQRQEAARRRELYLANRPPTTVQGKTAIVVDDGIATGYTMQAAIMSLRKRDPARIVVGVPVAPSSAIERFVKIADDVVVVQAPENMYAVGQWYGDFSQVEDSEVTQLMAAAGSAGHVTDAYPG